MHHALHATILLLGVVLIRIVVWCSFGLWSHLGLHGGCLGFLQTWGWHGPHHGCGRARALRRLGTFLHEFAGLDVGIDEFLGFQLLYEATRKIKDQTVLQSDEGFPVFAADAFINQLPFIVGVILLGAVLSRTPVGDTDIASHLEASGRHPSIADRLLPDQARLSTHWTHGRHRGQPQVRSAHAQALG